MTAEPKTRSRAKARLLLAAKLAGTAVVFVVLFQFVPVASVWSSLKTIHPLHWLAVFVLFLAAHGVAAMKWRALIGGGASALLALRAHYAGLAANIALPGIVGGDLVRFAVVAAGSPDRTRLAMGSLVDRLIDLAALGLIALAGAALLGARAGVDAGLMSALALALLSLVVGGVFLTGPVARLMQSRLAGRGGLMVKIADALALMARRRTTVFACLALSVAIQTAFVCLNAWLAHALGAQADLSVWLFAWPLAKIIAMAPVSLGGLGVREASLSGLLAPFGVAASPAIAASLIWQSILVAAGLVGAVVQILPGRGAQTTPKGATAP